VVARLCASRAKNSRSEEPRGLSTGLSWSVFHLFMQADFWGHSPRMAITVSALPLLRNAQKHMARHRRPHLRKPGLLPKLGLRVWYPLEALLSSAEIL